MHHVPSPRFNPAPLALAAAMALCVPTLAQAQTSSPSKPVLISIAAQPLEAALNELSAATGIPIAFPSALVATKTAPAVKGTLTVQQALQQLLMGSGLAAQQEANGTIFIHAAGANTSAATLPTVNVTAQADRDGMSEGTGSYKAQYTSTATKLSLSPRETPQTISVVSRQQMDDFGMTSVVDALGAVSGITSVDRGDWVSNYYSRGFLMQSQYDGIPNPINSGSGYSKGPQIDTAFLDRVEVLQGASGLTSGAGYPGGTINLIRKRPTTDFQANAEVQLGSWSHQRMMGDISGPLVESGRIRGRLVVMGDKKNSFTDYEYSRRHGFYGVVEADLSPSTLLTGSIQHQGNTGRYNTAGIPVASDGSNLGLPRSTYFGTPRTKIPESTTLYTLGLEQKLGSNWSLKAAYSHNSVKADGTEWAWFDGTVDAATGNGATLYYDEYYKTRMSVNAFDVSLSGPFHLFGRKHQAAFGLNGSAYVSTYSGTYFTAADVNAYSFNPENLPAASGLPPFNGQDKARQLGAYGVAKFSLADALNLITGVRISNYEAQNNGSITSKETKKVSPYAGIIYDINKQYSVYASYSEIFNPQTYRTSNGSFVKPVTGTNYEIGIKGEILDKRLNVSAALFNLEQKNLAVVDSSVAYNATNVCNGYCYKAADKVTSRGIDIAANGQITSNLNLMAGYTYVHSNYSTKSDNNYASYLPEHSVRLAANYRLSDTPYSVGGTARIQSKVNYAGSNFTTHQGALAIFGLIAQYRINPHSEVNLAINNLFDKRYYSSLGQGTAYYYYGAPRNASVTLKYRF